MRLLLCAIVLSELSLRHGFEKTSEYVKTSRKAVKLTNEDFQSTVFNKSRYVFVYFFSSSCSDCEDYSEDMDELADHMRPRYNIIIASAETEWFWWHMMVVLHKGKCGGTGIRLCCFLQQHGLP